MVTTAQPRTPARLCARCGATSSDETARFCGICGAPVAVQEEPVPPTAPDGTVPGAPLPEALVAEASAPKPADPPKQDPPEEKPWKPPKHLPAGTLVDKKYAVLRVLGEGGMGIVYLARDIHTGLDVVVKAVRSELAHRDDVRARTLAEGRALATIDHPNVVHLHVVVVEGPNLFLVMQYIDGESLDRLIVRYQERGEKMPVDEALGVFRQVTAGVGAAHREGVVHRDLKPANVLLRRKDGVAKVTDFGIALVPGDASRPHTRGIVGSLWYLSPEQVTGRRDLDHRVDIYALGILLYQMLVGRVPFDAKSDYEIMKLHAEAPMPLVTALRADVPPVVDELLQRACAKDREQRFQTCDELAAAVDRIRGFGPASYQGMTMPGGSSPGASLQVTPPPAPTLTASRPGDVAPPPVVPTYDGGPAPPVVPSRGHAWLVIAITTLLTVAVVAVAGAPAVNFVRGTGKTTKAPRDAGAPEASGTASKPPAGLAALVGSWVSNGRELSAVMAGGDLEFRVTKPEQFKPQGYVTGDARFVLRATASADVYAVEDRIRPVPPVGKTYHPRARGTCQEVWTHVGGEPLHAKFDGVRLSVEFAKIEPGPGNFTSEGAKVTSCVGLRDVKASKVVSVLTRK